MIGNPVLKLKATRFLSPTSPTIDEVFEKPETVFEEVFQVIFFCSFVCLIVSKVD